VLCYSSLEKGRAVITAALRKDVLRYSSLEKGRAAVLQDVNTALPLYLGVRVWIPNGPAITGMQVGDSLGTSQDSSDTAQLVSSLRASDPVHSEPSLHIIDNPEVFSSFLNLHHVHESSWELGISPGLPINLHQTLLHDRLHLLHVQGVLQTVPEEESNRKRLSLFVWARAGFHSEHTSKFVQHP